VIRAVRIAAASLLGTWVAACGASTPAPPVRFPPVVVMSPYRASAVVVRGAKRGWWKLATGAARYGDPLPVGMTMYCLKGTTRRGSSVRAGIVAADPKFFPLARYLDLYLGRRYLGQFLVDDTGERIKGPRIDIWTSSCAEARRFGVQRGTAVRVHKTPATTLAVQQAGSTRADR
jgi:3D (Asp-Asp-Asp) domain-containing protein